MSAPAIIEMDGVVIASARNPELPLLDPVDWRVAPGESWVVAGLQGSGKTTVLEAAAGLHQVTQGKVRLFGGPVPLGAGEELTALRRRIGIVFEGNGRLFPSLTVLENVMLPLRYHRDLTVAEAGAELAPLVAALHVERLANFYPAKINRAWARNYQIMLKLASNPRTPMGNVISILTRLQLRDLLAMSKNRNVSDAVRKQSLRLANARAGR